jgi:tetratricopeptide (TPR) repeat protein
MKPGEIVDGRYVVAELAGEGGMALVYRARDTQTGSEVALKLLRDVDRSPDATRRFVREARVLADLHHPGIVRYLDQGVLRSGEPYLVMEWLSGETLHERIAREGPLSVDESIGLAKRTAKALSAAHTRGVLHRDIKPHNLFLRDRDVERVMLLDFGVARRLRETLSITRTDVLVGTPAYVAPEQVRGERQVDVRVDLYALGCVLFECLTGRCPFEGQHILAVLAKILFDEPPLASELCPHVPRPLSELIARMLSKEPDKRPSSAEEVGALLSACGASDAAGASGSATRPVALTSGEQRLVSVLLASPRESRVSDPLATLPVEEVTNLGDYMSQYAVPLSAQVERLMDGSVVAIIAGAGTVADQAQRAARCALAVRAAMPDAEIALTTGRALFQGRMPIGQVIDRATALLRERFSAASMPDGHRRPVHLDSLSAELLAARFSIGGVPEAPELHGEKSLDDVSPTLLGKATPCVGRDHELRRLEGFWEECVAEPRSTVLVITGAPGIGKSRLRRELIRRVEQRGELAAERLSPGIWQAEGDPLRAGTAFGMIRQMIRRAAGMIEQEPLPLQRRKLKAFAVEHLAPGDAARAAEILGEIAGAPFPDDENPDLSAARVNPSRMNEMLRLAFEQLVSGACLKRPLLIVLDDIQWGDNASLQLIDATVRKQRESPLMILALGRPEVRELFPKLFEGVATHVSQLLELSRKASALLVREILGAGADTALTDQIITQAGGNAFYLEELLRAVAKGSGGSLPETVLGTVEARLLSLEPEARRTLRAASVFGEVFWAGGVAALLAGAGGEKSALDWLSALAAQELISPRLQSKIQGDQEYAFRHALVREAAYGMLPEPDRTLGHRLAGEWLERALLGQPVESPEAFNVIGEHYARGEAWAPAADYLQRAGEAAAKLFAGMEACAHFEHALGCLARLLDTEERRLQRLRLLVRCNELAYLSELPERNLKRLLEAEDLAQRIEGKEARLALANIHGALGRMHIVMGDLPKALIYLRRSIDEATTIGAEELVPPALASLVVGTAAQGRWSEASEHARSAAEPLERAGDWMNWFIVVGVDATSRAVRGLYEEATRTALALAARAAELEHPTALSLSYNYLLYTHFAGGNAPEMLKWARASVEAAERSGDRMLAWVGYWIGSYAMAHLGDHDGAARFAEQARALLAALGGKLFISHWATAADAVRLLLAGQLEGALAAAEEAIAMATAVEDIFSRGIAERVLAQALASSPSPRWAEVDAHFAESERLLRASEAVLEVARTQEAWSQSRRARGL